MTGTLHWPEYAAAFLGALLLDDLRGGISPYLRLALEVTAGAVVYETGSGALLGGPAWVDLVVTVVWVVGITNAFNLLDNMDGLSAGVAAITAGAFGLLAAPLSARAAPEPGDCEQFGMAGSCASSTTMPGGSNTASMSRVAGRASYARAIAAPPMT